MRNFSRIEVPPDWYLTAPSRPRLRGPLFKVAHPFLSHKRRQQTLANRFALSGTSTPL